MSNFFRAKFSYILLTFILTNPTLSVGSKLLFSVTGYLAPDTLRLGPADALAETHATVLAARVAGLPGPLQVLAPQASLLHIVFLFGHRGGEQQQGREGQ